MEYIKFVIAIAAVGFVVALAWRALFSGEHSIFARARSFNPGRDPLPPLKRTVDGLAESEIEHMAFEGRIDAWQKSYEARREQFAQRSVPVSGQKYEFVPPAVSRARNPARNEPASRFEQRFQLLN